MNAPDILPLLGSISVMKTTTGSVTVTTPNGPVLIGNPGTRYDIAKTPADVEALLKMSNLSDLLKRRLITLVM